MFLWISLAILLDGVVSVSDKVIVNLDIELESGQINVSSEIIGKTEQSPRSIGKMTIGRNLLQDLTNLTENVKKLNNVILLRAKSQIQSKLFMDCYFQYLLKLLTEKLNTTLIVIGKLSTCFMDISSNYSVQSSFSQSPFNGVFILSVIPDYYKMMLRDLISSDQQNWKEAVVIYDQPQVFSSFYSVMDIKNKIFHFRYWTSDRSKNAEIIRDVRNIKTYIINLNTNELKLFFQLVSNLDLLNVMTTKVIIIDRGNILEVAKDYAFLTAEIIVIRPTIFKNQTNTNASSHATNPIENTDFDQKVVDIFLKHLQLVLNKKGTDKPNSISVNNSFISPVEWIKEFEISIATELELLKDSNFNYYFDFNFEAISLSENSLNRIAHWSNKNGFVPIPNLNQITKDRFWKKLYNKTLRVTTIYDSPFVIYNEFNQFTGMAIDILKHLSKIMKFNYTLQIVKDNRYGILNKETGNWTGMIGELVNNKADMAVAPITVTYERERDIDFTIPWLSVGITAVIKRPTNRSFHLMNPFSTNVWLMIFGSYIIVSMILFLVGRMTPYEWYMKLPSNNKVENKFSILNSFWYTMGSVQRENNEISPKAISTRMISTIWWTFIIIIVILYTANLEVLFQTESIPIGIENFKDLSEQTKIEYGTVQGGSTYAFFMNSNIKIYEKMWKHMQRNPRVYVSSTKEGLERVLKGDYVFIGESSIIDYYIKRNCDLMKFTSTINYRGFAIGLPSGSTVFRDQLSEGILLLEKEQVLESLRYFWFENFNITKLCSGQYNIKGPLSLDKMKYLFLSLIILLIISCFVACCEMVVWASKYSSKNKNSLCSKIGGQLKLALGNCDRYKPDTPTNSTNALDSLIPNETFPSKSETNT